MFGFASGFVIGFFVGRAITILIDIINIMFGDKIR